MAKETGKVSPIAHLVGAIQRPRFLHADERPFKKRWLAPHGAYHAPVETWSQEIPGGWRGWLETFRGPGAQKGTTTWSNTMWREVEEKVAVKLATGEASGTTKPVAKTRASHYQTARLIGRHHMSNEASGATKPAAKARRKAS